MWFSFFFPQGKELAMLVSIDLLAGGPQSQHSREVCFFICSSTGCWASPPLSPYRRFWETENFYHILNRSAWLYTETPRERPCSVTEFVTKRILHNEEVKASNQILFFFLFSFLEHIQKMQTPIFPKLFWVGGLFDSSTHITTTEAKKKKKEISIQITLLFSHLSQAPWVWTVL